MTPWTVARQSALSMGFFRQEYWSGWPFPSPGDLPDPGMETALQADSLHLSHQANEEHLHKETREAIDGEIPVQ